MSLLTELGSFGFAGCYKDVSPDGLSCSERQPHNFRQTFARRRSQRQFVSDLIGFASRKRQRAGALQNAPRHSCADRNSRQRRGLPSSSDSGATRRRPSAAFLRSAAVVENPAAARPQSRAAQISPPLFAILAAATGPADTVALRCKRNRIALRRACCKIGG